MNARTPTPRELEQLFCDLEDGLIQRDDHAWLMDLLRERPEIRQAYLEHMALANALTDVSAAWMPERKEAMPVKRGKRERRSWQRPLLAAVAMIGLLAVIGGLFMFHRERSLKPAVAVSGPQTLWNFERGGLNGAGDFLPETRVRIDYGTVELTTRHGTRMLLEGPAVMEIHDRLKASLLIGKCWFDVAAADKGFTVLTGRLRATDLGTRFGISVAVDRDRIQTESGRVVLESLTPGAPKMDLRTGHAAVAGADGLLSSAPYDAGLFLHDLPVGLAVAHWSFDREEREGYPVECHGLHATPIQVKSLRSVPVKSGVVVGRFGAAIDLSTGSTFGECDFQGISGTSPRTVAFWVRARPIKRRIVSDQESYTPPVMMWGDERADGTFWSVRVHCVTGLVGTQWGRRGWVTAGKTGSQNILDDRWHHVTSVYTGRNDPTGKSEIRHYIDGKRVTTTQRFLQDDLNTGTGDGWLSRLRLAYDPYSLSPATIPLKIDELYIFRAALDEAQIGSLYRDNRLPPAK